MSTKAPTPPQATVPRIPFDPFSDEVLTDPTEFYRALTAAGPLARVEQSEGHDVLAVGRHAAAVEIYEDPARFLNSRGQGLPDRLTEEAFREAGVLAEADPPDHTAARSVIRKVISPRAVRQMGEAFNAAAEAAVDHALDLGTFDAQTLLAEAFPLKVIPDLVMGVPEEGRENLIRYSTVLFEHLGPMTPRARRVVEGIGDIDEVRAWVTQSCTREKVGPASLGARIWEATDAGAITAAQAANMVRSLLGAGLDSAIHSLGASIYRLATNPDQWRKLRQAPERATVAFDEALRIDPPVRQVYRTPARDTEVGGMPLREGQKMMLVCGALNRDPEHWGPDADRFDIDRRSGTHLALGRGIHQCVGAPIARLEADALLGTLARRVATLELDGTPEVMLNNTVRGFRHLPVRVTAA
ncbi:cytochrome P450 [Streptomyces mirabilis]